MRCTGNSSNITEYRYNKRVETVVSVDVYDEGVYYKKFTFT